MNTIERAALRALKLARDRGRLPQSPTESELIEVAAICGQFGHIKIERSDPSLANRCARASSPP